MVMRNERDCDVGSEWNPPGTKVSFTYKHGGDFWREEAKELGIVEGEVLTILSSLVSGYHTDVQVKEYEGTFNSVMLKCI